ncbi:MAG: hypothetical protein WBO17_05810 [Sphingorhabdus sp.]
MSGWLILGLLAIASLCATVVLGRLERGLWQVAAAAILLGMTGYALQGRPNLPSSFSKRSDIKDGGAIQLVEMRGDMDRSFGVAKRWLVTADAFAKQGDYQLSAAYIQSGLRQHPDNSDLWSAMGLQLMLASQGKMSPAAQLAFDKARIAQPNHPAPYYFAGIARLFGGDVNGAILLWERALSSASPNAKWKTKVESQLKAARTLRDQMTDVNAAPSASN